MRVIRPIHRALVGGVLGVLALGVAGAALAQSDDPRPDPFEPSRFGIVEAYYRPADARDLGVGWERIIFEWAQFQPNGPDEFETGVIPDEWLSDAQLAGRDVVGLLKNTPYWASGTDLLGAPPAGLDLPIDHPENYWAAFVRRVVAHYAQRWDVHHWIIYNEPDIRPDDALPWHEFDGDVRDYFQMVKVAYLAARSVDPDAVIHLAGMMWWGDVEAGREPYLQRLLQVAVTDPDSAEYGYYFDVVHMHVYLGTEDVLMMIETTRAILSRFGLEDKPLWVDETNASPTLDPLAPLPGAPFPTTLDQQADFIVQAAALSLAADVERFAVYRLYDDHFVPGETLPWGLVRADGSRRPAFAAYRMVINTFEDTLSARLYTSKRSALVMLRQPGRTVYVMWARSTDPVQFQVEAYRAGETATQVSVYGATGAVESVALPGKKNTWYVVDAPGATPDENGAVHVQGSPVILVVGGLPRTVWIEVTGDIWRLR
jgi:hypothetical protein